MVILNGCKCSECGERITHGYEVGHYQFCEYCFEDYHEFNVYDEYYEERFDDAHDMGDL